MKQIQRHLLGLLLAAAGMLSATPAAHAGAADSLSYNDRQRFQYFYLEALRQREAGHQTAAYGLLRHCLDINPKAAEVHFLLAAYDLRLENDTLALERLRTAALLSPGNSHYQERLAQFYISTGRYAEAKESYESLWAHHRDRSDVLNVLVSLYQQDKEYDRMLSAIERLEQAEGSTEETTLAKMHVYELMEKPKKALQCLKDLVGEYPNEMNYRVMMANYLLQNNQPRKAKKIFDEAFREEPSNAYLQASLYDYYRAVGDTANTQRMRGEILTGKNTPSKNRVALLRQVIMESEQQGGDSISMLRTFREVEQAAPKDADVAQVKAAYMTLKKMPQEQVDSALLNVLRLAPDLKAPRLQLLQSYWNDKKWQLCAEQCTEAIAYNPDDITFHYYLGQAYYIMDRKDEALGALRRGLQHRDAFSSKEMLSDFYSVIGEILHEKRLLGEAYAAFDSALQYNDANLMCLNNYAYFLALEGGDLKKAEEMSYKTVQMQPDNANNLDTYAWILFLEKRYDEALTYIEKALEADTAGVPNAVILEHAGDIHALLGKTDKAVDYWQQALLAGGEQALLERKIKLRKYISSTDK